ncbi:MAG TPA: insulinase family protein [Candidatus Eremiobacteraceae bacterium]|nr:insulinase family protein [Candidatus Eremiobacteraceae bacterium]
MRHLARVASLFVLAALTTTMMSVRAAAASAPQVLTPRSVVTSGDATFPGAGTETLPNGVVLATQGSAETPIVSVNVFLPAGAAQQPPDRGGIAGLTAAVVLGTRVDGGKTLSQAASDAGASLSYTIDPENTRFSLECKADDLARLMNGLGAALRAPDASALPEARKAALQSARDAIADPSMTVYAMVKQSEFAGTGYATLDQGSPTALASTTASDVEAFAGQYRHGHGTVVALSGDVTPAGYDAVRSAFLGFAPNEAPRGAAPPKIRANELVAHRAVAAPWVAVGFSVPSQFSSDFPVMLVIEALLGRGGDVHSFSYGSAAQLPAGFVGGYYQYEAEPGMLVEFYNGVDIVSELRTLNAGVSRLRTSTLPAALINEAKSSAEGTFLTSIATLDDQSWLLGRSVLSPSGILFENQLPARIKAVTPADVRRVAQKYLGTQTLALVSPNQAGP